VINEVREILSGLPLKGNLQLSAAVPIADVVSLVFKSRSRRRLAALQCGKALPYCKHSMLDRGYAARCVAAAMPHLS
jgi:hypothetical protein